MLKSVIDLSGSRTFFSDYTRVINMDLKKRPTTIMQCLKLGLKDILAMMGQVPIYFIIDTLNECPNDSGILSLRANVLKLVEELVDLRHPNLRLCITSLLVAIAYKWHFASRPCDSARHPSMLLCSSPVCSVPERRLVSDHLPQALTTNGHLPCGVPDTQLRDMLYVETRPILRPG